MTEQNDKEMATWVNGAWQCTLCDRACQDMDGIVRHYLSAHDVIIRDETKERLLFREDYEDTPEQLHEFFELVREKITKFEEKYPKYKSWEIARQEIFVIQKIIEREMKESNK